MENSHLGVRNQGKYKDMTDLLTEKQWKKQGKKIKDDAEGITLYTNGFRNYCSQYYESHEVRDMTEDEVNEYRREENERKKKSRKKAEIRNRKQMKEDISNFYEKVYYDLFDDYKRDCEVKISEIESAMKSALLTLSSSLSELPIVPCDNPTGEIVLNAATTGLEANDEIIQLSIIDGNDKVLFNEYIKPCYHIEWEQAELVHGVSPDVVRNGKYLFKYLPVLMGIFASAKTIVVYDSQSNLNYLFPWGIRNDDAEIVDVMQLFAPVYGDRDYEGNYPYWSLSFCSDYFGYKFNEHDNLEGAKATLYCWRKLKEKK